MASKAETAETTTPVARSDSKKCMIVDIALRFLLLTSCVIAVALMATSKQTVMIPVPAVPGLTVPVPAKFTNSPAFIYFVVALSVAGLYSIVTLTASLVFMSKPNFPAKLFLILAVHDVVTMGIVAAATGTAGGIGYVGLKGNSHVNWGKICNVYDKFCRYLGTSIFFSLFAATLLVALAILNAVSLYKRIPSSSSP